jgi:thiol-disulfide isomerase/thioredoxin
LRPLLFAACLVLYNFQANAFQIRPFVSGSWEQIKASHKGRPTIIHFWAMTCGPCLTEMAAWGKFRGEHREISFIFVDAESFGSDATGESTGRLMENAKIGETEHWKFSDPFEERLRFEIEPNWMGEMPFTILITPDGQSTTILGAASFEDISDWLNSVPQ